MPAVTAFRGLGYSMARYASGSIPQRVRLPDEPQRHPGRLADVTDVVSPPYDVIGDVERARLLARDPRNAVRLELSAEADPYAAAAAALAAWRADGTLARAEQPSVYYYAHPRSQRPDDPAVRGVLARVLLEPWGSGVRPHERTRPGPKRDRLDLLRATQTQLSPILAIYFDRSQRYRHVMSRPWSDEWRARDGDGLLHQLAAVEPDARLLGYLSRQRLLLADGHHRYETAIAFQQEVRDRPENRGAPEGSLAADWVMAVLVNAEQEELEIRPTHRVISGLAPGAVEAVVHEPGPLFEAEALPVAELPARLERLRDEPEPAFGVVLGPDDCWLLTGRPEALGERMRRERGSTAVRGLDVAVLHAAVLRDRLGIDPDIDLESSAEEVRRPGSILYTKDPNDAIQRVLSGDGQAAFLVRPTRMEQLADVAAAGDLMPHKSTYFYPKLLTGMAFYPLED